MFSLNIITTTFDNLLMPHRIHIISLTFFNFYKIYMLIKNKLLKKLIITIKNKNANIFWKKKLLLLVIQFM